MPVFRNIANADVEPDKIDYVLKDAHFQFWPDPSHTTIDGFSVEYVSSKFNFPSSPNLGAIVLRYGIPCAVATESGLIQFIYKNMTLEGYADRTPPNSSKMGIDMSISVEQWGTIADQNSCDEPLTLLTGTTYSVWRGFASLKRYGVSQP